MYCFRIRLMRQIFIPKTEMTLIFPPAPSTVAKIDIA